MQTPQKEISLDVNNTPFLKTWELSKLYEYRDNLINTIASLVSQLERNKVRIEYEILDEDGKCHIDLDWIKKVTFTLEKAKMIYAEVIERVRAAERWDALKDHNAQMAVAAQAARAAAANAKPLQAPH